MNITTFLLFSIIALANAMPRSSSSENNNALLKVLHKRSIGCYGGCVSSCNSCSYSSCTNTCNNCISNNCCQGCCQNKCDICNVQSCQINVVCVNCCQVHCKLIVIIPSPTSSTALPTSTTESPTTMDPIPTTVTPPPTVTPVRIFTSNTTNIVKNDFRSDVKNVMAVQNNVHVPINIRNTNIVSISIKSGKIVRDTERLEDFNVSTTETIPTITSESDTNSSKLIIMNGVRLPHIYPLVRLPCFDTSCPIRRPYWTGRICDGWHGGYSGHIGYPEYTGQSPYIGQTGYVPGYSGINYLGNAWPNYGSGINLNDFYGCRLVHQDCTHCRSNFYRIYNPNSLRYSSCYGCLF